MTQPDEPVTIAARDESAEPQAEAAAPSLAGEVVPANTPVALAWRTYCASEDFANSFAWAEQNEHRKGSMWAAFTAGFYAARGRHAEDARIAAIVRETLTEETADTRRVIDITEYESWARKVCRAIVAEAAERIGE